MDDLAICLNIQCSTYVFGHAGDNCPTCGLPGKKFTEEQAIAFTRNYREVQNA